MALRHNSISWKTIRNKKNLRFSAQKLSLGNNVILLRKRSNSGENQEEKVEQRSWRSSLIMYERETGPAGKPDGKVEANETPQ